ncbi:MAG: YidB family protein [Usitatibacter sp.]
MSLFDTFASVLGSTGVSASRFANLALGLIHSERHGGIEGLLDRFRDLGLDDAVRSWVGPGKNISVSRDNVIRAIGMPHISELAQAAGIPPELAATELSSLLPQLIDRMTPAGKLPEGEQLEAALAALKTKIGMI